MEKIADTINPIGVAMRTTAKVREKWKNVLHSQARKEYKELTKEQKKSKLGGAAIRSDSIELVATYTNFNNEHAALRL